MANIGSLTITTSFQKLEDLLLNQFSYSFDVNAEYTIQNKTPYTLFLFEGDTPNEIGSFELKEDKIVEYQFTTKDLWIKSNNPTTAGKIVIGDNK